MSQQKVSKIRIYIPYIRDPNDNTSDIYNAYTGNSDGIRKIEKTLFWMRKDQSGTNRSI